MKKKALIVSMAAILVLGALAAINFTKTPISSQFILASHGTQPQKFVAHRGFSSVYPENTVPAIEGAIEAGFYGVEFDIHTTKDGVWILNHNSDIDKMTDGSGKIAEMTYDELQKVRIDNGNGIKDYPDLRLPKLEDVLKIISKTTIIPYIEIKGYDPEAFRNLIELIDTYNLKDTAIIISFDMEALLGVREIDKDIQLMYLTNNLTIEDVDICAENGNIGVDINGGNIFKMAAAVKYAEDKGLETAAWTVDFPILSDILNLFGFKTITTNRITP